MKPVPFTPPRPPRLWLMTFASSARELEAGCIVEATDIHAAWVASKALGINTGPGWTATGRTILTTRNVGRHMVGRLLEPAEVEAMDENGGAF